MQITRTARLASLEMPCEASTAGKPFKVIESWVDERSEALQNGCQSFSQSAGPSAAPGLTRPCKDINAVALH